MKINFISNDYLLAWQLLFGPSISEESFRYKQRLWLTYKKEYSLLGEENDIVLGDLKNYIPDNNIIFDKLFDENFFNKIKEETEQYRLRLMRAFDQHKKTVLQEGKEILRFDIKESYDVIVLHPRMDNIYANHKVNTNALVWGKNDSEISSDFHLLMEVLFALAKLKISHIHPEYQDVIEAVLELAINNELCTRLGDCSTYLTGDDTLKFLKKQIYPYWLMYLGATTDDELTQYMLRDKLAFEIKDYPINKELSSMDILDFIEFCINNQKKIVKIEQLEII